MQEEYICLQCFSSRIALGSSIATSVPSCSNGHSAMDTYPAKDWSQYSKGVGMRGITNFNPSARHVAFDCYICPSKQEIYIVVRAKLVWERALQSNFSGHGRPSNWTSSGKKHFMTRMRAAISVLDRRFSFRLKDSKGNHIYRPYFFFDFVENSPQVTITALSTEDNYERVMGLLAMTSAAVDMVPPYETYRKSAGSGTIYDVHFSGGASMPRAGIKDTGDTGQHIALSCAAPHEYLHLLGIPDEYDQVAGTYDTLGYTNTNIASKISAIPTLAQNDGYKELCIILWCLLLRDYGIDIPRWGQYGTKDREVTEHSIMRDVQIMPNGFHKRHYVTVLEALKYIAGTQEQWDFQL